MSKGNTLEDDILKLLFNATGIANLAINASASPATTLTIALHTADPGEAGTQATSETAYTGYARQTVARTSGGWTIASGSCSPVADITFPTCTAAPGADITHASIGTGVGNYLMYSGALSAAIPMAIGTQPVIQAGSTITED